MKSASKKEIEPCQNELKYTQVPNKCSNRGQALG